MSLEPEEKSSKKLIMQSALQTESPVFADRKDTALFNILRGFEEFILNKEGNIISSNLEAVNVTGYEEWEVIGSNISIFYTPEESREGRPGADLNEATLKGVYVVNGWRTKKRNTRFWAKMKISALYSAQQQVTGFKVVLRDTTHKALYNHRVKRIKEEYLNLFNNSYTGIFKFRVADFLILLLNEKAKQIIGREEFTDLSFRQLFASDTVFEDFRLLLTTRQSVESFEFEVYKAGREQRWASISCRCFTEQGFAEGIIIDITESKKQILELQRLNYELDQFIYHASHDLRSPLTTILGLTNLIALDKPAPLIAKYTELINERVHHLDGLLKDLVSITFNNKTSLQAECIELETEMRSILKEFQHQYTHVRAYLSMKGNPHFITDAVRFRTIVRNLVSNGLKYHNPHAEAPYIKILIEAKVEGDLQIEFIDNGIGIEDAYLYQIFGMFFRATTSAKGTGLGLYIVKSMIDKLGGQIDVKSAKNRGTTFLVQLPALAFSQN